MNFPEGVTNIEKINNMTTRVNYIVIYIFLSDLPFFVNHCPCKFSIFTCLVVIYVLRKSPDGMGNGNKVASLNANRFWKRSNKEYKGRTRVKGMVIFPLDRFRRCLRDAIIDRCSVSLEFRPFYTIETQSKVMCELERNFYTIIT